MSQQSFHQQTATGADIDFTITTFSSDEIKVYVDGVLKSAGSDYNINPYNSGGQSTVDWIGSAPTSPAVVRIIRQTDVINNGNTAVEGRATYQAGSSVKADDLNNNTTQALRAIKEQQDQKVQSYDFEAGAVNTVAVKDLNITTDKIAASAVTSAKIADGTIVNADVNASAGIEGSKIQASSGSVAGTMSAANFTKLAGIETGATADQTAAEIKTLVGNATDSNVFTDAEKTKLSGIETAATADQTNAEIRTAVEAASDSNVFTDADHSKLNAIEAVATQDQTAAEIKTLFRANNSDKVTDSEILTGTLDNRYYTETESDALFLRQDSSETIASGVTWSSVDSKVATTAAIDARIVDLVEEVGGFVHIANQTSFPTANPDINNAAGTVVSVNAVTTDMTPSSGTVTIANGAGTGNTVTITGVSATIPSGFGFLCETTTTSGNGSATPPRAYTFIRLSAKATEINTCATNITQIVACGNNLLDIENFADLYQVSSSAPTQRADGGSLTVGDLWFDSSSNQSMMVYDGSSGDGFSPITPTQATIAAINSVSGHVTFSEDLGLITNAINTGSGNNSINTVGANITNVNTAATNIAKITTVADDLNEGTSEIDTVATNIANVNTVGNAIANVNTTAGSIANVNTTAGSITNVNTTATNISNVNTVASNITDVNTYANRYRIDSSAPSSSLDVGDLYFDTTQNELRIYNGSAWQGGVTATGNLLLKTGGQMTGNITFSGTQTVDGRDLSADGSKLDGIETAATADQTASEIVTLISGQTIAPNVITTTNLPLDFGSIA